MVSKVRFAVVGDSFAEGVGDELPDGYVRGWGDLAALGWATALGEPIEYANFAVRGRKAWQIGGEQLDAALALKPTHIAFNAGANDVLRPRVDIEHVADAYSRAIRLCDEHGVQLILLSSANPTARLPLGKLTNRRGDQLDIAVAERVRDRHDILQAANWVDTELSHPDYWAEDRLHLNVYGHHRVAARMLFALGVAVPETWWTPQGEVPQGPVGIQFYRQHVWPWVVRRVRGRSSGDGVDPKHPEWVQWHPA